MVPNDNLAQTSRRVRWLMGGRMMLVPERSAWGHPFALAFFLVFAIAFWWIALAAPGEGFAGGSFFLSTTANVRIARIMFGSGALLASGIVVHAVYRMIRGGGLAGVNCWGCGHSRAAVS